MAFLLILQVAEQLFFHKDKLKVGLNTLHKVHILQYDRMQYIYAFCRIKVYLRFQDKYGLQKDH